MNPFHMLHLTLLHMPSREEAKPREIYIVRKEKSVARIGALNSGSTANSVVLTKNHKHESKVVLNAFDESQTRSGPSSWQNDCCHG